MVILSECGHKQKGAAPIKTAAASIPQHAVFIPPQDSSISAALMTAWFSCNHELDSLSSIFTESLSANNAAVTDSVQKWVSYVQDRICVKNGLTGGYKEYRWIMEHMGSAKNKTLYDSITMRIQKK